MRKLAFTQAVLLAFIVGKPGPAVAQESVGVSCLHPIPARSTLQFYGYAPYGTGIVVGEAGVAEVVPKRDYPTYSAPSPYRWSRYSATYPPLPTDVGYYSRSYLFQRR
jgi:hypothetical protein